METLQRETVSNEMQKFKMSVTGSYSNDAMLRQIFEGARIDKVPKCSLIHSKNEWNYLGVPRAIVAHDSAISLRYVLSCWLTFKVSRFLVC